MLNITERPRKFEEVVGQECAIRNLKEQSRKRDFFQFYILKGQFGSGKTTVARILAKAINCEHVQDGEPCGECPSCLLIQSGRAEDVLEIDGASHTGVDHIRSLKEMVFYLPVSLQTKVIIIDEVQCLSEQAFSALLKVLEEPPKHAVFVLCTTDEQSIPETVRSRAAQYDFRPIPMEAILKTLLLVSGKHEIKAEESGLQAIAKNSSGSLRNALNLMEQVSKTGNVTEDLVTSLLGLSDTDSLFQFVQHALNTEIEASLRIIAEMERGGKDFLRAANDLLELSTELLKASYAGADSVSGSEEYVRNVRQTLEGHGAGDFLALTSSLLKLRNEVRLMPDSSTFLAATVDMLHKGDAAVTGLQKRIQALEEGAVIVHPNDVIPEPSCPTSRYEMEEAAASRASEDDREMPPIPAEYDQELIKIKKTVKKEDGSPEVGGGTLDIWDLLGGFSIQTPAETTASHDDQSVLQILQETLTSLYREHPLLEAALELGCTLTTDKGIITYHTSYPLVYRILQCYSSARIFEESLFLFALD